MRGDARDKLLEDVQDELHRARREGWHSAGRVAKIEALIEGLERVRAEEGSPLDRHPLWVGDADGTRWILDFGENLRYAVRRQSTGAHRVIRYPMGIDLGAHSTLEEGLVVAEKHALETARELVERGTRMAHEAAKAINRLEGRA